MNLSLYMKQALDTNTFTRYSAREFSGFGAGSLLTRDRHPIFEITKDMNYSSQYWNLARALVWNWCNTGQALNTLNV